MNEYDYLLHITTACYRGWVYVRLEKRNPEPYGYCIDPDNPDNVSHAQCKCLTHCKPPYCRGDNFPCDETLKKKAKLEKALDTIRLRKLHIEKFPKLYDALAYGEWVHDSRKWTGDWMGEKSYGK